MEEKATLIESLVEKAEIYTKSSIDLFKLQAIDKSAKIVSSALSTLVISIVVIGVIMLVSIGASLWVGELIGSSFSGFFIVAAFYSILAIFLCVFRKSILKTPFSNRIITNIREDKNI